MKKTIILLSLLALLASCTDTGRTLPSATGSIYEILVVADESSAADRAKATLGADMPCLPQMEPYFNVTTVRRQQFDDVLKPTRNILLVDVNAERYTKTSVYFKNDVYSHPQAVCVIQLPQAELFDSLWDARGEQIRQWFVRSEIDRQNAFNAHYVNAQARESVQKRFGADMLVPSDYQVILDTLFDDVRFLWMCNDKGTMRRDLVLYSYPYLSQQMFTEQYQLAKRDSVMGRMVHGKLDGTYMGTEYNTFPPVYAPMTINKAYAGETRGLWKMYGGLAMGGPFVAISRLDVLQQRVVTAETFIFAAGQKKRNALRQSEAVLYSLKLSEEVNALQEVDITKK